MADSKTYVEYEGPSKRDDNSTVFYLDGVRLEKGKPVEVDSEVANELLSGEGRVEGHKFSKVSKTEAQERLGVAVSKKAAEVAASDSGGPAGSGGGVGSSDTGTTRRSR